MTNDQHHREEHPPLASENPAMPESETVSEFGDVDAKEREVAIESANDPESGGIAEQEAYLKREAEIDEEERREKR